MDPKAVARALVNFLMILEVDTNGQDLLYVDQLLEMVPKRIRDEVINEVTMTDEILDSAQYDTGLYLHLRRKL